MMRTPVNSRAIKSLGYDAGAHKAEIEMLTGKVYVYAHVTPAEFKALAEAPSIGKQFAAFKQRHRGVSA